MCLIWFRLLFLQSYYLNHMPNIKSINNIWYGRRTKESSQTVESWYCVLITVKFWFSKWVTTVQIKIRWVSWDAQMFVIG